MIGQEARLVIYGIVTYLAVAYRRCLSLLPIAITRRHHQWAIAWIGRQKRWVIVVGDSGG